MDRPRFYVSLSETQPTLRCYMPRTARWLLNGLCVLLLLHYFMQPGPLLADSPLVTLDIHYDLPQAGEVFLVWGFDGWQPAPGELRPAGTVVEYEVMNTPMALEHDTFVAQVQVPAGTTLDYGFQTRKTKSGDPIEWVWDGDYHLTPQDDGVLEVKAAVTLAPGQTPAGVADRPATGLPLLIGLSLILVTGTTLMMRKGSASTNPKPLLYSRRLTYLRDLLRELVIRDIKLRYKGSFLGVAWSLINPLVQLLVLGFVFGHIVPLGIPNYTAFLIIGLLTWSWLQSSLFAAATAIIDGRSLIKRPGFPAAILPIVTVAANLIHFLFALPVLFLFLVFLGVEFTPVSLILPVIIVLQFAFTLGLAYFIATFHVTFRDTQHLVGVFLLLTFYLTPIFYDASLVPERFQPFFRLNPILHLLDAYRAILLYGELPNFTSVALLFALSAGLILWGYRVFVRTSYHFIEEL